MTSSLLQRGGSEFTQHRTSTSYMLLLHSRGKGESCWMRNAEKEMRNKFWAGWCCCTALLLLYGGSRVKRGQCYQHSPPHVLFPRNCHPYSSWLDIPQIPVPGDLAQPRGRFDQAIIFAQRTSQFCSRTSHIRVCMTDEAAHWKFKIAFLKMDFVLLLMIPPHQPCQHNQSRVCCSKARSVMTETNETGAPGMWCCHSTESNWHSDCNRRTACFLVKSLELEKAIVTYNMQLKDYWRMLIKMFYPIYYSCSIHNS